MQAKNFEEKDMAQIESHGLTEAQIAKQIRLFEEGVPYADLDRPCTVGDGIYQLSIEEVDFYVARYEKDGADRQLTKFVPASGAATRMFKALLKISGDHERIDRETIVQNLDKGGEYKEVLEFIDNIEKFAFYETLSEQIRNAGHDIDHLRKTGDYTIFISYLLTSPGLNYSSRPKGQILFHRYPDRPRTAFEEHLVEAVEYAQNGKGDCSLHFTVSPEHENGFKDIFDKTRPDLEKTYNVTFDTRFSHQHPSTDTIAVDLENRPFRDANGKLVFRPGGHGALIDNLNDLKADIVFIKNIDNVVPDPLKSETILWKKVLAGYLLTTEKVIEKHKKAILDGSDNEKEIAAASDFVETQLGVTIPVHIKNAALEEKRQYLIKRFDRPLRICGMVPSSGEPGGGPFWVKSPDGSLSMQIVENAQIDPDNPEQQKILKKLDHFNPVDIVCSLRNDQGSSYDLKRFIDESAVFISYKSKDGRDLKALEHPGLWNGAMAHWNTVFIEVPLITFNPVKTVNDLLRETHQG